MTNVSFFWLICSQFGNSPWDHSEDDLLLEDDRGRTAWEMIVSGCWDGSDESSSQRP